MRPAGRQASEELERRIFFTSSAGKHTASAAIYSNTSPAACSNCRDFSILSRKSDISNGQLFLPPFFLFLQNFASFDTTAFELLQSTTKYNILFFPCFGSISLFSPIKLIRRALDPLWICQGRIEKKGSKVHRCILLI